MADSDCFGDDACDSDGVCLLPLLRLLFFFFVRVANDRLTSFVLGGYTAVSIIVVVVGVMGTSDCDVAVVLMSKHGVLSGISFRHGNGWVSFGPWGLLVLLLFLLSLWLCLGLEERLEPAVLVLMLFMVLFFLCSLFGRLSS